MNLVVAGPLVVGGSKRSTEIAVIGTIDLASEAELQVLLKKKSVIKKKLAESQDKIIKVNLLLRENNQDLVSELIRIEDEYATTVRSIINAAMAAQGRTAPEPKGYSESKFNGGEQQTEGEEEEEWKPKKISKKVKTLFGKIASATHPDRTAKDSELVREEKKRMFMEAKVARDENNYKELARILKRLQTLGSTLLHKLIISLEEVRQEVKSLQDELKVLQGDGVYAMSVDYLSGFTRRPTDFYRRRMQETINERKTALHTLDNSLYPEVARPSASMSSWFV